jgi:hypothetical protein
MRSLFMAWVRMAFVIVALVSLGHIRPPSVSAEVRAPLTSMPLSAGMRGKTIGAFPSPRPDVLDAAGEKVAGGLIGQGATVVPEGIYTVAVRAVGRPHTTPDVRIDYNGHTTVELKKEGQEVGIRVLRP